MLATGVYCTVFIYDLVLLGGYYYAPNIEGKSNNLYKFKFNLNNSTDKLELEKTKIHLNKINLNDGFAFTSIKHYEYQLNIYGTGYNIVYVDTVTFRYWKEKNSITISGQGPSMRFSFAHVRTKDYYYIHGGQGTKSKSLTNELHRYDIRLNKWIEIKVPKLSPTLRKHCMVHIDGILYILGGVGVNAGIKYLDSIYLYNINENTWETRKTEGRGKFLAVSSSCVVYNNRIMVYGSKYNIIYKDEVYLQNILLELDIKTFKWKINEVKDKDGNDFEAASSQTGFAVNNQLLLFFGKKCCEDRYIEFTKPDIQILNLDTFRLVDNYVKPDENWFKENSFIYVKPKIYKNEVDEDLLLIFIVNGSIVVFFFLMLQLTIYLIKRKDTKYEPIKKEPQVNVKLDDGFIAQENKEIKFQDQEAIFNLDNNPISFCGIDQAVFDINQK